jgi:hypothetical protein
MSELRVELHGETAQLGQVSAADVARLILEVQHAMRRVASSIVGKPKGAGGGRYKQSVEDAVRLRLRGIEPGSVVPVLALPEARMEEGMLAQDDYTLAERALSALVGAAEPDPSTDPIVAEALLEIAEEARVGERYESLDLKVSANGRPRQRARIDSAVRQRLRAHVETSASASVRPDIVIGVLFEADFERETARLRTPTGVVEVRFTDDQADDIHAALRQQATMRGEVAYDPKDHVMRSITLREVVRGQQLAFGLETEEFWRIHTFHELAAIQGSGRPVDPEALYDDEASDAEREAYMAALKDLA